MAWYEVTLEGFTVHNETWDTMWQTDGKRDEVYIYADIRVIDGAGNLLLRSEMQSDVMGDVNGFPHRILAGSASSLGGLKTGDHFPYNPPWVRQGGLRANCPPMLLWAGELRDDRAVTITPTVWEWDGGTDLFNEWGRSLVDNGPAIAAAVMNIINATAGTSLPTDAIKTNLQTGLPALYKLLNHILGQAGDRPIGMVEEGGNVAFKPQSLVMTNKMAEAVGTNDFGYGPGIVGIRYQDAARLAGNYMLYIKVSKTGDTFTFNDGTLWRERSSAPVYVTFGGAKFWIPSPEWLFRYGDWSRVTVVPDGALAAVPVIPREGTVLREWSSAPVYVMKSGQKCWITTPALLDEYGGWSVVRVVPDGGLVSIPDGPALGLPPIQTQADWRWCHKCQGLFFGGGQSVVGRCPAGGQHEKGVSGNYTLVHDSPGAPGQADWRWCHKCQGLFFGGGQSLVGRCPAGGQHEKGVSGNYTLVHSPAR